MAHHHRSFIRRQRWTLVITVEVEVATTTGIMIHPYHHHHLLPPPEERHRVQQHPTVL